MIIFLLMFFCGTVAAQNLPARRADLLKMDTIRPTDDGAEWRKGWVEIPEWGGRIGRMDKGVLWVQIKDRSVPIADDVRDFQLMDWRIAVLKRNGSLFFAEGPLSVPLKEIAQNVQAYQMTLTRVGILQKDGAFLLKEHGFLPRKVTEGVKSFQVTSNRVAVLDRTGNLSAHHGGHVDGLMQIATGVQKFQLEREWVAVVRNNKLQIAKGDLRKLAWVDQGDATDFEMEVTVELGQPKSKLQLALVRGGQVWTGEGEEKILLKSNGMKAKLVRWAEHKLAVDQAKEQQVTSSMRPEHTRRPVGF